MESSSDCENIWQDDFILSLEFNLDEATVMSAAILKYFSPHENNAS